MITEALVVPSPGDPFQYSLINVDDNLCDNEVLVEMKATGVCHTDLNFRNEASISGLHPAVFGHEGAWVVFKTGSLVTNLTWRSGSINLLLLRRLQILHLQIHLILLRLGKVQLWYRSGLRWFKILLASEEYPDYLAFLRPKKLCQYAVMMETSCVKIEEDVFSNVLAPLGCGTIASARSELFK